MAGVSLYDYQTKALSNMHNGCILNGGVGSGKSRTALAYYYICMGGKVNTKNYAPMFNPCPLYIITTARKRDTGEWNKELGILIFNDPSMVTIDSWNNINKYSDITNAFFIFDEQRVVGSGAWVKAFLKIAKNNQWILLSATPGDSWMDYVPVFLANGYFRNRTEFNNEHVVFSRFCKFPKVDRYLNTGKLIRLRNHILVDMDFKRETVQHNFDIYCSYDKEIYKNIMRDRWDIFKDEPIASASELCYCLRRICNTNEEKQAELLEILDDHPRAIIFYNYDYELEILLNIGYLEGTEVAQWNGHAHQEIPDSARWVYLVQYNAGAEGWNCIKTDTIIFWSMTYSYKQLEQAKGRIDRLNTPYTDLYYYHFKTHSNIDLSISSALKRKKKFNEGKFVNSFA